MEPATQEQRLPPALYLVGTPIGNRQELTPRAVTVLEQADVIACEDTRHAQRLLSNLQVTASLRAYHEHNERDQADNLADLVASGQRVALITDAGMPAISDPGFRVVRACRARGLPVTPISGPCAATIALAASGLPTDGFLYLGFLPPKTAARKRTFERWRDLEYTLVFYESTHRIEKFVDDVIAVLGADRCMAIGRELTKLHETFYVGPAAEVKKTLLAGSQKGEFVVMIAKAGYQLQDSA
ncbi:MAG: 16S rRNA (cytidine(1402)-2'-O)-methyltransferase [Verrucomicrobiota bacterium JB022]|nr:16S rRNA (cytidine(1402)-2'-O)-methyltransferase [Verrucomicrobiota bacterium JB022]